MTSTTTDDTGTMPPHLRRTLAGLDKLIARAEAAQAWWAADGRAAEGDTRATTLASLADERLAQLRGSRAAVLVDNGRRRGAAIAGKVTPVADDLPA